MSLIRTLIAADRPRERSEAGFLSMDDFANLLTLGNFPLFMNQTLRTDREEIDAGFAGLVSGAYRSNGIVFACILARMLLFSEARFQFQQMRGGRPGDLFGTSDLQILERPEPGKTTGDLLTRAIIDVDLAGNWFGVRRPNRIKRLRPDWVTIVLGSPNRDADVSAIDIDAEVIGYIFKPGGQFSSDDPEALERGEVAHFAPIPDPLASYRGMSWLTPIIREITADSSATQHKAAFFSNAATPNLVVKFPALTDPSVAKDFIETFEQDHSGAFNAYRTLFLLGGADIEAVGRDFQQMDFKATQGAGETRIAAAAGMHPTIVGLSEGLQGSSLNAGNFDAAARITANKTLRPMWRNMAGSLETIVPPPPGSRLWYDDRDIPFLAEDIKVAAEVLNLNAQTIRTLWDGGAIPSTVIDAVTSGDLKRIQHSGFLSVQMQSIGQTPDEDEQALLADPSVPQLTSGEIRCPSCHKLLAEQATPPYRFTCTNSRCKAVVEAA